MSSDQNNNAQSNIVKMRFWFPVIKWLIGGVGLVVVTLIIDKGFRERTAGLQEMQAFDKYVEIILKADNIEERWKLTEFFSTVTPTDRLRERWNKYRDIVEPDYKTFKKLKQEEFELKQQVQISNNQEAIKSLIKVKKQLEPFEKKLAEPTVMPSIKNSPISSTILDDTKLDEYVKTFRESVKKDASTDSRYKLDEDFKTINKLYYEVVNGLIKDLGAPYSNIQTELDYDFNNATYRNQLGIFSNFDREKKIWPKLTVKFNDNSIIVALEENGKIERNSFKLGDWENIRQYLKAYYVKRLNNLR